MRFFTIFVISVLAWASQADTYNFYFEPKKKGAPSQQMDDGEETSPAPVPVPAPVTAAPIPVPAPIVTSGGGGGSPIVIHNNITVPQPSYSVPTPTYSSPAPAYTVPTPNVAVPNATLTPENGDPAFRSLREEEKASKWMLGLSLLTNERTVSNYASYDSSYTAKQQAAGLSASISYRLLPTLGINAFVGMYKDTYSSSSSDISSSTDYRLLVGGDLNLIPIRWGWADVNFVEAGICAGGSTFGTYSEFAPHIGLVAAVNFTQTWGMNMVVRANRNATFGEVGVLVRL